MNVDKVCSEEHQYCTRRAHITGILPWCFSRSSEPCKWPWLHMCMYILLLKYVNASKLYNITLPLDSIHSVAIHNIVRLTTSSKKKMKLLLCILLLATIDAPPPIIFHIKPRKLPLSLLLHTGANTLFLCSYLCSNNILFCPPNTIPLDVGECCSYCVNANILSYIGY